MGDFVSQATIDAGLTLVPDALGHDQTALAILQKTVFLEPGSVIAVQGSWGRGKTDVLMRIAALIRDPAKAAIPEGLIADALWINPWQYGTPDLLTPLVLAILERIPEEPKKNNARIRKIAEALLRAGINFGMKAAAHSVPILGIAADGVDKVIAGLFDAAGVKGPPVEKPDADPVAAMGDRFRELAQTLLDLKQKQPGARLIVCVDDLDRCLPDRQVALLEAIRFLISAGAPVTFLIALDPTLARQAIVTHYRTDAFDPDRYLDKMFELRVNLPSLGDRVGDLVRHHMEREVKALGATMKVGAAMESLFGGQARKRFEEAGRKVFSVAELSNPRIVRRIFDRLYLLAVARSTAKDRPLSYTNEWEFRTVLMWIGVIEKFPQVRAALQAQDNFPAMFSAFRRAYLFEKTGASMSSTSTPPVGMPRLSSVQPPSTTRGALSSRSDVGEEMDFEEHERAQHERLLALYGLPAMSASPGLALLFEQCVDKSDAVAFEIDEALRKAGL
ncbi:MAG: P-loop NTPase fold protein [Polyangiaceae bacterium]